MNKLLLAAGAVVASAVAVWLTGALDRPLANIGLNNRTCIEPLLGDPLCGDDAVAFCRDRYNPDINADVCGDVLREAGVDVAAVERRQAEQEREERAALEERLERDAREQERQDREDALAKQEAARNDGEVGQRTRVNDVAFTVNAFETAQSIPGSLGPIAARQGRKLVVARFTYENIGEEPLDLLCGGRGFRLVDDKGRRFTVSDDNFEAAENEEACGGGIQPGETDDAAAVFEVQEAVAPVEVVLWNDQEGTPEDGVPHLAVPAVDHG